MKIDEQTGCEWLKCPWFKDGKCTDLQEYVNKHGEVVCGRRDDAIPLEETISSGAELIAKERKRQIEKEGFCPEHDSQHDMGQLVDAARCYLTAFNEKAAKPRGFWPWDNEDWKPSDRVRNLVKAGALIAAEIDRINRRK